MQPKTKEALPAGSTVITVIVHQEATRRFQHLLLNSFSYLLFFKQRMFLKIKDYHFEIKDLDLVQV